MHPATLDGPGVCGAASTLRPAPSPRGRECLCRCEPLAGRELGPECRGGAWRVTSSAVQFSASEAGGGAGPLLGLGAGGLLREQHSESPTEQLRLESSCGVARKEMDMDP